MCVLNTKAVAALGTTQVSISYPGEPARVPPAFQPWITGNPQWTNDLVLIFAANIHSVWQLCAWDSSNWNNPITGANALGQNYLYAGGSRWAAQLDTPSYRDSFGFITEAWWPLAVDSLTGLIAIKDRRDNTSHIWGGANTSPVTSFDVLPQPCFKDGTLLYRTVNGPRFAAWPALSIPPAQVSVQGGRSGCWHSGGWRLSYPNDALGLVVHGWADTSGLQLHGPGEPTMQDNNPDIQAMPDGTIQVVSARTEGEAPGDLQRYAVNMAARTVNGKARAWVNLS